MASRLVQGWWRSEKHLSTRNAWFNIVVGIACLICVVVDLRLGLGALGRWYLGYFALVCCLWGLIALRWGRDRSVARPLRLAGDLAAWAGLAGFAVFGLLLEPAEFAALWTLLAFIAITIFGAIINRRSTPGMARNLP
jgi:hypothetical protein